MPKHFGAKTAQIDWTQTHYQTGETTVHYQELGEDGQVLGGHEIRVNRDDAGSEMEILALVEEQSGLDADFCGKPEIAAPVEPETGAQARRSTRKAASR